jgi:hypothetical protein
MWMSDGNVDTKQREAEPSRALFKRLIEFTPEDQKQIVDAFSDENLWETSPNKLPGNLIEKIESFGKNPEVFPDIPNLEELVQSLGDLALSHRRKPIVEEIREVERMSYATAILESAHLLSGCCLTDA